MNQSFNLTNIKKCGERFDKMATCGNHKICAKCKEKIYDFRGLTNWEIAVIHSSKMGKVCGIYEEKQLKEGSNIVKEESKSKKRNYYYR